MGITIYSKEAEYYLINSEEKYIMVRRLYRPQWFIKTQLLDFARIENLQSLLFFNKTFIIKCQLSHTQHLDGFSNLILQRASKSYWKIKTLFAKSLIPKNGMKLKEYLQISPFCEGCTIADVVFDQQDAVVNPVIPTQSVRQVSHKNVADSYNSYSKNVTILVSQDRSKLFVCKELPEHLSLELNKLDLTLNQPDYILNLFKPKLLYSQAVEYDQKFQQKDQLTLLKESWGVVCPPKFVSNIIFSKKSKYYKLCARQVFNQMLKLNKGQVKQLQKQPDQLIGHLNNFFYPADLLNFRLVLQERLTSACVQFQEKAKFMLNIFKNRGIKEKKLYFEGQFDHFEDFNLMAQGRKYYTRTFLQVKQFDNNQLRKGQRKSKVRFEFNCFLLESHFKQIFEKEKKAQNPKNQGHYQNKFINHKVQEDIKAQREKVNKLCHCYYAMYFRKMRRKELIAQAFFNKTYYLIKKQLNQIQKAEVQQQRFQATLAKQDPFFDVDQQSIANFIQKNYFFKIPNQDPFKILLPPLTQLLYLGNDSGQLQSFSVGPDICAEVDYCQETSFNQFYFKSIYRNLDKKKIDYAARGQIKLQCQDFEGAFKDFESAQRQSFNKGNFKVSMYKAALKQYLKVLRELSNIILKVKKQLIKKFHIDVLNKLQANMLQINRMRDDGIQIVDSNVDEIEQDKQRLVAQLSTKSIYDWLPQEIPDDITVKKEFVQKNQKRQELFDLLQKLYKETTVRSLELQICNHYVHQYKNFFLSNIKTDIEAKIQNLAQEIHELRQQYKNNQLQSDKTELELQRKRIQRTISFKSFEQWNLIMFLTVSQLYKKNQNKHIEAFRKNFKYLNQTFFSLLSKNQTQIYEKWKKSIFGK